MVGTCETVEIKTEPTLQNPSGIVIINKEDLTSDHVLLNPELVLESSVKEETDPAKEENVTSSTQTPPWGK